MSRVAVGVDGGGTSARAVVVDEQGVEVARAEAPGAVVTLAEPDAAAAAVCEAVRHALARAGVRPPAAVLWAGLSGAGSPEARAAAERALSGTDLAERTVVGTDAEAAFHDAFGPGPGILLICGTGSGALARAVDGRILRAGGWGGDIGDEGSGYGIGVEALRRVARADDGREDPTALRVAVLEHLGLDRPRDLVAWIASASKADVAGLVPVVIGSAAERDGAARAILDTAVAELALLVRTLLRRAGPWPEPPGLALSGGLVRPGGPLRRRLVEAVREEPLSVLDRAVDPPRGAARMALALLSV